MRFAALACTLVGACSNEALVFQPVIELPSARDQNDAPEDANPFAGSISRIELSVLSSGREVKSQSYARGESIELTEFPFGEDLVIQMRGFDADRVLAFGRTCSFELSAETHPAPHLFFSTIATFADRPQRSARQDGHGLALDGMGLFIGGHDNTGELTTVDVFDPATGEARALAGTLAPRTGEMVALREAASSYLVFGGEGAGAELLETVDASGVRQAAAPHEMGRVLATATSLGAGSGDDIIVIGGRCVDAGCTCAGTTCADNPLAKNVYGLRSSQPGDSWTASMLAPRMSHTATRLGTDPGAPILVAGGVDSAGATVDQIEIVEPYRRTSTRVPADEMEPAVVLKAPRSRHHAPLLRDGSVVIIGGVDTVGQAVTTIERFSLVEDPDEELPELAAELGAIDMTETRLPDGRILFTGGRRDAGGPPLDTAFIVDVGVASSTISVLRTANLSTPRAGHQAVLLCDGTVLITGGTADEKLVERYNPIEVGR
ncbi:MAG: hypothetical protein AB7P03_15990 [Kofleriaceae bacterium]